jgi:acetyl esterase
MTQEKLHPDAQKVIDLIVASGRPPFESLSPAEARVAYAASRAVLQPDPEEVAEVAALTAPGPGGAIPLRLYRGDGLSKGGRHPALIYFHGGGWVIGDLDSHDQACRALANATPCVVVSVDYRLAPEHKFPAAAEDAIAATQWVAANAAKLGIDDKRLAVGGDSAGGNLAAVVAIDARDRGSPRIGLQFLVYPASDMGMDWPSAEKHAHQLPLTRAAMDWFIAHYMRNDGDKADWRASPLRARNLKGLAPALIVTAGFDPLCDQGEAYARALRAAGVSVAYEPAAGQIHGFLTMGRIISESRRLIERGASALREAFERA